MRAGDTQSVVSATPNIYLEVQTPTPEDLSARIVDFVFTEQVYGGLWEIWLDNSDSALASKDYNGYKVDLEIGFSGGIRSQYPTLWVQSQARVSEPGRLLLKLNIVDAWGLLAYINTTSGAQYWNYGVDDSYDDKTIQQIVTAVIQGALDVTFAIDVDHDDGYFTALKPLIQITNTRNGIFQLMEMTDSFLRYENDDDFHVRQASQEASVYTFALGDNELWQDAEQSAITMPNRVIYHGLDTGGNEITGTATDDTSYTRVGVYMDANYYADSITNELVSDQTLLNNLATATLAKIQGQRALGTLLAPMHCSLELLDKITITDTRYSGTKTITGYVHGIRREYRKGIYRIFITLGGAVSGYTGPQGAIPTSMATIEAATKPGIPSVAWGNILPKAIQGYTTDITFSATDGDTVAWTSGTIKFYDGTTQSIDAGNTGNIATTGIYYIYFDLDDASPNVLKVVLVDTYVSTNMDEKTGVLCVCQKTSTSGANATFLPSYGKQPLITPDWIDMSGLKEYDYGSGTKIQAILSTQIQAGQINLSAAYWTGSTLDQLGDGATYAKVLKTIIAAGYIQVGSGTKDSTLSGWKIDSTEIVGQSFGTDTVILDTSGAISIKGAGVLRFYDGATYVAVIDAVGSDLYITQPSGVDIIIEAADDLYLDALGDDVLIDAGGTVTLLSTSGILLYHNLIDMATGTHSLYDITPSAAGAWIGTSINKYARGYFGSLPSCPEGLPAQLEGISTIKRIRAPQVQPSGEIRFMDTDFPNEMKIDIVEKRIIPAKFHYEKILTNGKTKRRKVMDFPNQVELVPTGSKEIEYIRTIGVLVQSVRELIERVETLEGK